MMNSTTSKTVEFVFAPEERDVYSYERTIKIRSFRSEIGTGKIAAAGKGDCAPAELEEGKGSPGSKHLAPMGRSDHNFQYRQFAGKIETFLIWSAPTCRRFVMHRRILSHPRESATHKKAATGRRTP
jgi:hypothetical protein